MAQGKICGGCGNILDPKGCHAQCCAPGESTKGHNMVRGSLATIFSEVDPSTEQEVVGLIADHPSLRPADILTQAAHARMITAVDTMVASPHSSRAGADATEEGKREHPRKNDHILEDLAKEGIQYQPAVFSTYGRMHRCQKYAPKNSAQVGPKRRHR